MNKNQNSVRKPCWGAIIVLAGLIMVPHGSFARTSRSVFGPFKDFQAEVPLDQQVQGLQTHYYHCWTCPPYHGVMCGYGTDFVAVDSDPGATGTLRVLGVAFDTTTAPTREKPDPDFTVTTIYGLDLNPGGSTLSMAGFTAADPELDFHDEMLVRLDGESYLAGPVTVIPVKDVSAFLGLDFDLSFLGGSPDDVVEIFQTIFPHSEQWNVFAPFELTSAVSQKAHGTVGIFSIDLPLTGRPGIECREGGSYTVVATSSMPLASVDAVTATCGSITSSMIDSTDPTRVIVNLSAPDCNAQNVSIGLSNLTNTLGDTLPAATVNISLLNGDVDGNGTVTKADLNLTKAANGQETDFTNFRKDVNVSGAIDKSDAKQVKQRIGTSLP